MHFTRKFVKEVLAKDRLKCDHEQNIGVCEVKGNLYSINCLPTIDCIYVYYARVRRAKSSKLDAPNLAYSVTAALLGA
jgi:hypothetical protein